MPEPTSVLVVDDNEDLLDTFSLILKRRGFSVDTAANGAAAVEKFRAHPADVILMDIIMPEMNGIDAVRKIMEFDSKTRIVMCSALGQQALVQEAIAAGAKDFLIKPFNAARVVEVIAKVFNQVPTA